MYAASASGDAAEPTNVNGLDLAFGEQLVQKASSDPASCSWRPWRSTSTTSAAPAANDLGRNFNDHARPDHRRERDHQCGDHRLAIDRGFDVTLVNRGLSTRSPKGAPALDLCRRPRLLVCPTSRRALERPGLHRGKKSLYNVVNTA
jgi:hypothetical protein